MKASHGLSDNSWNINDRDISSDDKNSSREEIKEQISEESTHASDYSRDIIERWLNNESFSMTQIFENTILLSPEDRRNSQRKAIISKIASMWDIFTPYDEKIREVFLSEMHLILIILEQNEIIEHVLPSFSIFTDEVDHLKLKFLNKITDVVDTILTQDFKVGVDNIVINVFPVLETMLK